MTSDGERLRFESFSGCCGVYARFDVTGLDGDVLERGTTNVDVNPPLQTALAKVGGREPLHLSVGPDDLTVSTFDGSVVERKVTLPQRWLRGFAEAPVVLAGMDLRADVDAVEARRFLRSLPRSTTRGVLWAVQAGRSLRLTTRAVPGAVCVAGPERLEQLQSLLRFGSALRVYGPPADGVPAPSAWEVELRGARLTLTLSPDLSRGFSGEGGVLTALATDDALADAERVADLLAWLPGMSLDEVATAVQLPANRARAALLALGTSGRVGYDVADTSWFSRELPYDTSAAEALNPRLSARRLIAENRLERQDDLVIVRLDDHVQHVRLTADGASCTCTWWAAYGGRRGPCKHVLARAAARVGACAVTLPEELDRAVRQGDIRAVRALLAGADEAARKACVPVVKRLSAQVREGATRAPEPARGGGRTRRDLCRCGSRRGRVAQSHLGAPRRARRHRRCADRDPRWLQDPAPGPAERSCRRAAATRADGTAAAATAGSGRASQGAEERSYAAALREAQIPLAQSARASAS